MFSELHRSHYLNTLPSLRVPIYYIVYVGSHRRLPNIFILPQFSASSEDAVAQASASQYPLSRIRTDLSELTFLGFSRQLWSGL